MNSKMSVDVDRRDVIRAAAALACAVAIPVWAQSGLKNELGVRLPPGSVVGRIDESLARALLGSDFKVSSETASATTRLESVAVPPAPSGRAYFGRQTQSFSMEFNPTESSGDLIQDTYRIEHAELGSFELFLVPHRNRKGETILLATFNRL